MIEPTPPAAPMMMMFFFASPFLAINKRSNKISHAVMLVKGKAAASAKLKALGFRPTMRSSTTCNSLFAPARVMSPAYHTSSPALNKLTSAPTARTTPTASHPKTFHCPSGALLERRTLVSTGLAEMALISTKTSRPIGSGTGNSTSINDRSSVMGNEV